jgi:hypothetical protein
MELLIILNKFRSGVTLSSITGFILLSRDYFNKHRTDRFRRSPYEEKSPDPEKDPGFAY